MTFDERTIRHDLHEALDKLVARWLTAHPGSLIANLTVSELMIWSYAQTTEK